MNSQYSNSFTSNISKILFCSILFAINFSALSSFGQDRLSPFKAVKWEGEKPIVLYENNWYEVQSMNKISLEKIIVFCQEEFGENRWKKRFSEDLMEVFDEMGVKVENPIPLVLKSGGETIKTDVLMTEDNRNSVRDYNNYVDEHGEEPILTDKDEIEKSGPRNASALVATGYKRYHLESGSIKYEFSGSKTGTETLYFDDYGWREAVYEESVTKVLGMKQKSENVRMMDGEWMINYNPKTNYATRTSNPLINNLLEGYGTKDLSEAGKQMFEGMGGEIIGNESILERECEIWEVGKLNTKVWIWNGISLKEEVSMLGITTIKTAISIDLNSKIEEEKFKLPKGVKGISSEMPFNN